jgi:hypothetical protein
MRTSLIVGSRRFSLSKRQAKPGDDDARRQDGWMRNARGWFLAHSVGSNRYRHPIAVSPI